MNLKQELPADLEDRAADTMQNPYPRALRRLSTPTPPKNKTPGRLLGPGVFFCGAFSWVCSGGFVAARRRVLWGLFSVTRSSSNRIREVELSLAVFFHWDAFLVSTSLVAYEIA